MYRNEPRKSSSRKALSLTNPEYHIGPYRLTKNDGLLEGRGAVGPGWEADQRGRALFVLDEVMPTRRLQRQICP
jgi:hypothetical protein